MFEKYEDFSRILDRAKIFPVWCSSILKNGYKLYVGIERLDLPPFKMGEANLLEISGHSKIRCLSIEGRAWKSGVEEHEFGKK